MDCKSSTVECAPDDEGPCSAVPQTSEEHHDDQVSVGSEPAALIASKWNIEIIVEPRRERDMPGAPELRDVC